MTPPLSIEERIRRATFNINLIAPRIYGFTSPLHTIKFLKKYETSINANPRVPNENLDVEEIIKLDNQQIYDQEPFLLRNGFIKISSNESTTTYRRFIDSNKAFILYRVKNPYITYT